jgi:hypothetical protein
MPRLQSELTLLIDVPLDDAHREARMTLRGHVVRRFPGPAADETSVGVYLSEEVDPEATG